MNVDCKVTMGRCKFLEWLDNPTDTTTNKNRLYLYNTFLDTQSALTYFEGGSIQLDWLAKDSKG